MKNIFKLFSLSALIALIIFSNTYAESDRNHDNDDASEHHQDDEELHNDEHGEADHDDAEDEHHGHEEELATRISDEMAASTGIKTASAAPRVLQQTIVSYGSLNTGPEQLSHVRARYPGMIKSVKLTVGDAVKRGDLLAEVESNESLKNYRVISPIDGTIIQRHANTGESTENLILFSIANFETLWAELRIYPGQQALVHAGQTANIVTHDRIVVGAIQHVLPELNKPYQIARVRFDNSALGLSPGMLVEGLIVTDEIQADLAVKKTAIQTLGRQQGVFIKDNDEYEFTPLQLGRSDNIYIEVLDGIDAGDNYVAENSYLIKADIEKSEAEHVH